MPDLLSLAEGRRDAAAAIPPNVVEAVIARAPSSPDDELAVIVPSFDAHRLFEIRFWNPRGLVLPSVDDEALVAFSEDGEPWLVAFSSTLWDEGGAAGAAEKYATSIGDGSSTEFLISHGLGTSDISAEVLVVSTGRAAIVEWWVVDANSIRVRIPNPPSSNQFRVVVTG